MNMDKELFERMQELANVKPPSEKTADTEDDLNYYVYELLEDAEIESQCRRTSSGYTGYIKLIIETGYLNNKKFSEKDIVDSLKFEKVIYKQYLEEDMDLSPIVNGDNLKVVGYDSAVENGNIILTIKYTTDVLFD